MIDDLKQPTVKLFPSDPTTNTTLIIYCLSSSGTSIAFNVKWRRKNLTNSVIQQIDNQSKSSYRCSPLDIYCIIEATVAFQYTNNKIIRSVQSDVVKVSSQLKERMTSMRNSVHCHVSFNQIPIQAQILLSKHKLLIFSRSSQQYNFVADVNQFIVEASCNHHMFKLYFKYRFEQFLNFYYLVLGRRPQMIQQHFLFTFNSDIARDIILLGIAQAYNQTQNIYGEIKILLTPPIRSNFTEQRSNTEFQTSQKPNYSTNRLKNRSQTSLYPFYNEESKTKSGKQLTNLKASFNGSYRQQPQTNTIYKSKDKYNPNIFQQEDSALAKIPILSSRPSAQNIIKDQPSLNLKDSFQELQRSFNILTKHTKSSILANNSQNSNKQQQEIQRLKKQNQTLKKQLQIANNLQKQNSKIKKMYIELKEDMDRLQMQKKIILTDKLRFEVNLHKEMQEKDNLKKQLQHVKSLLKHTTTNHNFVPENFLKNNGYEVFNTQRPIENKQRGRSPHSNLYNH